MRFEFFLAKRFLAGQRFGVFRMVTTVIAIGGTALGVAALLVTLAIMDGFRTDIQEKILGTQPHIVVVNPFGVPIDNDPLVMSTILKTRHVQAASPFIDGQALLQSDSRVTGILLRGIRPELETRVTRLSTILTDGRWENLDDHGIILGQELNNSVRTHVGEKISLVVPQQDPSNWTQVPRIRSFKVVGIFHSGMYEQDANLAYLDLNAAGDLLGIGKSITGYGVRLDNVDAIPNTTRDIQQAVGPQLWARSWEERYQPLFSAMKLERTVMFIVVTLIILVSSFTIISNLLLLTLEKAREIGILQAIGASPRQIGTIFLMNGLMLGGSGVGLGLLLGIGISALLKRYNIIKLPADVYYVDRLPIRLSVGTVESVAICAFILVLISILYPAAKAREMDPIQAIRYG